MNVVVVNDTAHVNGGAAKLAIAEALGLADRGHSVCFVAAVEPIGEELSAHPNIRVLMTNQFDLLADPNRLRAFIQGWWNVKAGKLAHSVSRELSPEHSVVHLHVWSRSLSSSVARAFIDAKFPVVCTLHDFVLACPTGTFFHQPREAICTLRPMSASCLAASCDARSYSHKLWRVGRNVAQNGLGHIPSGLKNYIVHSSLALEIMKPFLPENSTFHRVVSYIDAEKNSPAEPGVNEVFLYLGRLVKEKGVSMLARSAAAERLKLTFVGSGPLESEICRINPDAHITGWVDSVGIARYLRNARSLIFPSLWYETLGLVVLEAAAQGIPSIVPDTSAAREVVQDGISGLHFRGGDERDLRLKMRRMNDPIFAAEAGKAAYEIFWNSQFPSLDEHISQLEKVYDWILPRSPAGMAPNFCLQAGKYDW